MIRSSSYLNKKAKSKIKAKSKELVKKFGNLDTKESKAQSKSKERERTFESSNADSLVFGQGLDRKKGKSTCESSESNNMNSDQFHATISEELEVTDQKCRSQNKDWSTAKRCEYDNIKSDQFHATISEETESELTLDLSESDDREVACGGGCGEGCLWKDTIDIFQRHHNNSDHLAIRSCMAKHNSNSNQQRTSKQSVLNKQSVTKSQDTDEDEARNMIQDIFDEIAPDMMPPISSTEVYIMANNNEKTNSYIHDIIITSYSDGDKVYDSSSFEVMNTSTSLSDEFMDMSVIVQSLD